MTLLALIAISGCGRVAAPTPAKTPAPPPTTTATPAPKILSIATDTPEFRKMLDELAAHPGPVPKTYQHHVLSVDMIVDTVKKTSKEECRVTGHTKMASVDVTFLLLGGGLSVNVPAMELKPGDKVVFNGTVDSFRAKTPLPEIVIPSGAIMSVEPK